MYEHELWWYDVQNPKNNKEVIEVCCLKVGDHLIGKSNDEYFRAPTVSVFFSHCFTLQVFSAY